MSGIEKICNWSILYRSSVISKFKRGIKISVKLLGGNLRKIEEKNIRLSCEDVANSIQVIKLKFMLS